LSIQEEVLEFRRQQKDEIYRLLPLPATLFPAAERRILEIREHLIAGSAEFDDLMYEGECISTAIKDIKGIRAWLIFSLAFSEDGQRDTMTADEWQTYQSLVTSGQRLRGEA